VKLNYLNSKVITFIRYRKTLNLSKSGKSWKISSIERKKEGNETQLVLNLMGWCGNQKAPMEHRLGTFHQLEQIWAQNKSQQRSHQSHYISAKRIQRKHLSTYLYWSYLFMFRPQLHTRNHFIGCKN